MAALMESPAALLSYDDYINSEFLEGGYDIVEGVKIDMPGASWEHQQIVGNIYDALRDYARLRGRKTLTAPFDLLIRRAPRLQTRQPVLFYISDEQLAKGRGIPKKSPLEIAPELIIEVISDSETDWCVQSKLADYHTIGVLEIWRIWPETRTVELLRRAADGYDSSAVFYETEAVLSQIFPNLHVSVASIFAS